MGLCVLPGFAAEEAPAHFVGAASCSTSGCHGGASERSHQYLVWSRKDFHSRSYATLTSARSERLAEVLKLGDPTKSARCTVCHAPYQTLGEEEKAARGELTRGVSCETCHGPAEPWLRSHIRPDFTHADRVAAGMRDLRDLYGRANACVACHQNLDADLAAAGHPELIFELDGQTVAQPRHWQERDPQAGPKAWLVGQAVALREMSWQLAGMPKPDEKLVTRWQGLYWLLQTLSPAGAEAAPLSGPLPAGTKENFTKVQAWSDGLAKYAASATTNATATRASWQKLADSAGAFRDAQVAAPLQARRAERLVLALDRLTAALPDHPGDTALNSLFRATQTRANFQPTEFSTLLDKLATEGKKAGAERKTEGQ